MSNNSKSMYQQLQINPPPQKNLERCKKKRKFNILLKNFDGDQQNMPSYRDNTNYTSLLNDLQISDSEEETGGEIKNERKLGILPNNFDDDQQNIPLYDESIYRVNNISILIKTEYKESKKRKEWLRKKKMVRLHKKDPDNNLYPRIIHKSETTKNEFYWRQVQYLCRNIPNFSSTKRMQAEKVKLLLEIWLLMFSNLKKSYNKMQLLKKFYATDKKRAKAIDENTFNNNITVLDKKYRTLINHLASNLKYLIEHGVSKQILTNQLNEIINPYLIANSTPPNSHINLIDYRQHINNIIKNTQSKPKLCQESKTKKLISLMMDMEKINEDLESKFNNKDHNNINQFIMGKIKHCKLYWQTGILDLAEAIGNIKALKNLFYDVETVQQKTRDYINQFNDRLRIAQQLLKLIHRYSCDKATPLCDLGINMVIGNALKFGYKARKIMILKLLFIRLMGYTDITQYISTMKLNQQYQGLQRWYDGFHSLGFDFAYHVDLDSPENINWLHDFENQHNGLNVDLMNHFDKLNDVSSDNLENLSADKKKHLSEDPDFIRTTISTPDKTIDICKIYTLATLSSSFFGKRTRNMFEKVKKFVKEVPDESNKSLHFSLQCKR